MSANPCLAKIRGIPTAPSIKEINVRTGPGTNFDVAFKGQVGLDNLAVMEVQIDNEGKNLNGKVYQWFRLQFGDDQSGWVRDDLLFIQGECRAFGYQQVEPDTFAFALTRKIEVSGATTATGTHSIPPTVQDQATTSTTKDKTTSTVPVIKSWTGELDVERVMKAAFAITAAFEGDGYAAYNNYDSGIISYGIIQFTLDAGTLSVVVDEYLANASSDTANSLRAYQERIRNRDASLRNDDKLKQLLITAASETPMRDAQNKLMKANYWDRILDPYISDRQYKLPLTYALLFDIGVNFGVGDGFIRMAEKSFSVPERSVPEHSGVSEEQIISKVADLRKTSHDKQAARDNLPGLRVRGDFWVALASKGDWGLQGDSTGIVVVNGRKVQVANP